MKYTIYEHPITHRFALIKVPTPFVDGDTLPVPPAAHWFDTLEEAQATLPLLFIQEA